MRGFFFAGVIILVAVIGVVAGPAYVSLEVTPVRSNNSTKDFYQTTWGSYDKRTDSAKSLLVRVVNTGKEHEDFRASVYWLSGSRSDLQVSPPETCDFSLDPSRSWTNRFECTAIQKHLNLALVGYHEKTGSVLAGYIVRITRGDDLVKQCASSTDILQKADKILSGYVE